MLSRLLLGAALCAISLQAQNPGLAPLKYFEGHWEGQAEGEPGKGVSTREYRFEMGGRFLFSRNRSVWAPKKEGEKGEIHEDLGIFSFDRAAKRIVLRQFHVEGFVNEYLLESPAAGKPLEFVTTRIENIPAGWRARETYRIVSPDEFIEVFSLAEPGKDFERYSETTFRRKSAGAAR